jgi:hypothetical protein
MISNSFNVSRFLPIYKPAAARLVPFKLLVLANVLSPPTYKSPVCAVRRVVAETVSPALISLVEVILSATFRPVELVVITDVYPPLVKVN